jgi:hypothetical protein
LSTREVNFKLTGDAGDAQKAFAGISKSIDRVGKEVKSGFGSTGGAVKQLSGEFQNLGTQLGLAFGLSEVVGLMKQFGAASIAAARESAAATAQLEAVLKSTGGAAGVTAQKAQELATAFQKTTNFTDEATLGGESLLLTFKNIGSGVFPQATAAMLDMSQAMGQDIKSSAIQLGKALNDPVAGISALTRVGVTFSDAQKAQIEQMVKFGDVAGAQKIIIAELNSEFGGSAAAAREAAGGAATLQMSYGDLQEAIGGLILAMGDTGATGALTGFLDKLTSGAGAWQSAIQNAQTLHDAINSLPAGATPATDALGGFLSILNPIPAAVSSVTTNTGQWLNVLNPVAGLINTAADASGGYEAMLIDVGNALIDVTVGHDKLAAALAPAVTSENQLGQAVQTAAGTYGEASSAAAILIGQQLKLTDAANTAAAAFGGQVDAMTRANQLALATAKSTSEATSTMAGSYGGQDAFTNNRALAGFQQGSDMGVASQKDQEKQAQDAEKQGEKIAKSLAKGMEKPLNDLGNTISSAVSGAVSQSKTDIAQLLGIDPEADGNAVNEDVRRMAAVATGGLNNEWTRLLAAELKGVGGAKAFVDAVKAGDDSAVREEARKLALDPIVELFNAEQIATGIEQKLRGEDLAGVLNKKVAAILSEKGLEVPPEMLAEATGSMPTEQTATDATAAAGQLSQSFDSVGVDISKKLEPASTALNTLDTSLLTTTNSLTTFANEIGAKFKTAAEKINGFQTTVKQGKWGDVGSAIVKGLVAGINANLYQVNEVLKDLAKEAIDSARDELGISSPSKEFFRIAQMIVAGLTGGVDAFGPSFQKAVGRMLQIDTDTFNLKDMVGHAADEVEEVMEGMNMEGDKVQFALRHMKDALRANLSAVAGGSATELKSILENAVGSWEKAGLGGEAGKALNSGMDAFISQIITLRTEFPKMAEAAKAANLEKIFGGIGKFANEATAGSDELSKRIAVLQTQLRQGGTSFNVEGQVMNRGQATSRLNEMIGQQTASIGDMDLIKKIQQTMGNIQSTKALTNLLSSPQQMTMPQIAMTTKAILQSLISQMGALVKTTQNTNNLTLNINSQATKENLLADFELLQSLLPSST